MPSSARRASMVPVMVVDLLWRLAARVFSRRSAAEWSGFLVTRSIGLCNGPGCALDSGQDGGTRRIRGSLCDRMRRMRDRARARVWGIGFAASALAVSALAAFSWTYAVAHAAPALKEVVFAPHRAVYDLSLESAQSGSGVAGVNGRIVYELSGNACEGYAQSMRFVTQTLNQEGDAQTTDLRTSSWEEVPARRLR